MTWLLNALLGLIPRFILGAIADWRARRAERDAGRAEERDRARREAERQEAEAHQAAEEAMKLPPETDDGWRRD